jgi:hypothetical protein
MSEGRPNTLKTMDCKPNRIEFMAFMTEFASENQKIVPDLAVSKTYLYL